MIDDAATAIALAASWIGGTGVWFLDWTRAALRAKVDHLTTNTCWAQSQSDCAQHHSFPGP